MADDLVLRAQKFINLTYGTISGIPHVEENGRTSWAVMYALTRCLQYELGISSLADSFGPTTLSTLTARWPSLNAATAPSANVVRIIQSALYCKGYDGGEIDGVYNSRVSAAVTKAKQDMGVSSVWAGDDVTPKVFKGLLNMDPYVRISGGSDAVRQVQVWMNSRYILRKDYFVIPCDGYFSRDVQKALMLAIQYESGMADGVANGTFGPGTQTAIKNHVLSAGSSGTWVQLFSAAMLFNQRAGVVFTSTFDSDLGQQVSAFQSFAQLPVTARGDFPTWASLLVSTGDNTRKGTAVDCVTEITAARAAALKSSGYQIVGRYLSNVEGTTLNKKIQPGELDVIRTGGLRVFPIYQTYGGSAAYFSPEQGTYDCSAAMAAASGYGFKPGTRIYFAIDYDAVDDEVTSHIIPHFRGIKQYMDRVGNPYRIGVYGPRNICRRVAAEGLTTASFVSDMSTGFSGNLGFPLPEDWAFDQIATVSVGSGTGTIEIDNDIASGRDLGQNSFNPVASQRLDTGFNMSYYNALLAECQQYLPTVGLPESSVSRMYTTTQCLETVMTLDDVVTSLSRQYNMRKALIQTSVLWEFCHYGIEDVTKDAGVILYYTGAIPDWAKDLPGINKLTDASTGIAQIQGHIGIRAWNNSIQNGLADGQILDPAKGSDIYQTWTRLNQDNAFSMRTVPQLHIWGADGKPGDDHPETPMRRPALDYTDTEIYEVLRRYQGWGTVAETDARKRVPLYGIFEKYNQIVRGL